MITTLAFFTFSLVMLVSALMVITARHPVHSVLFLILAFFNSAGLFVLLRAEFIAMLMVIVYVGAVAVLFLFIVMMLNVDFAALKAKFMRHIWLGLAIASAIGTELVMIIYLSLGEDEFPAFPVKHNSLHHNTEALGHILYTDYMLPFQLAGLILLVAMIGAITLTLHHSKAPKRQHIGKQVGRKREDGVELVQVETGKGV